VEPYKLCLHHNTPEGQELPAAVQHHQQQVASGITSSSHAAYAQQPGRDVRGLTSRRLQHETDRPFGGGGTAKK